MLMLMLMLILCFISMISMISTPSAGKVVIALSSFRLEHIFYSSFTATKSVCILRNDVQRHNTCTNVNGHSRKQADRQANLKCL